MFYNDFTTQIIAQNTFKFYSQLNSEDKNLSNLNFLLKFMFN